ncbi:MAG: DUF302 domain-containing protein [Myxococcales bacterium]|nr:DUF302 domain-containing protein [Myxococcales bacterium]
MHETTYGYDRRLNGTTLEEARTRVTEALAGEGFGILTEVDVRATLRKKLDLDFRPYVILGACNPMLAHRALQAEPHMGLLLPRNVVIQEADDGVAVSIANPRAMFGLVDNCALEPVVGQADERLRRVLEAPG